jgi:hypothetical protein
MTTARREPKGEVGKASWDGEKIIPRRMFFAAEKKRAWAAYSPT